MATLSLRKESDDLYLEPLSGGTPIEWRRESWWITLELRDVEIHHWCTIDTSDLQPGESHKVQESISIRGTGEPLNARLSLITDQGDDEPSPDDWKVVLRPADGLPGPEHKGSLSYSTPNESGFEKREGPHVSLDLPVPRPAFEKAVAQLERGGAGLVRISVLALFFRSRTEKALTGPDDIWDYHIEKNKGTDAFFSWLGIHSVLPAAIPAAAHGGRNSPEDQVRGDSAGPDTPSLSPFQQAVLERLRQIQFVLVALIVVLLVIRYL